MKELTIEEKAKAYDEVIERANSLLSDNQLGNAWIYKLLPELKESEDERIRKALIEGFKVMKARSYGECTFSNYNIPVIDIITCLEKQGEQKLADKVEPKFKQGDIIKEKETGNLFYINSIEDFGYTLHYKNCIAKGCTMDFKYEDNYELVEQKPAWSEEDERNLNDTILFIETGTYSLDKDNLINWLKSIKPQNTWRPSQEQMDALYTYIYNPQYFNSPDPRMELVKSVYQDLKKLRDE